MDGTIAEFDSLQGKLFLHLRQVQVEVNEEKVLFLSAEEETGF